jgi:hypothetical protein
MSVESALERIMKNARVHLPGALDSAIQLELFNVLDEFLKTSQIWREEVSFTVRPDRLTYDVESEDETALVVDLLEVKNSDGIPVRATMPVPEELTLGNLPQEVTTYTATVSLTVSDPVTTDNYPRCPEWILTRHTQGIVDGIIARLMSQPAKPYTSERLATYHLRRFRDAMAVARVQANHANLHDGQAWTFPQNFATGR